MAFGSTDSRPRSSHRKRGKEAREGGRDFGRERAEEARNGKDDNYEETEEEEGARGGWFDRIRGKSSSDERAPRGDSEGEPEGDEAGGDQPKGRGWLERFGDSLPKGKTAN